MIDKLAWLHIKDKQVLGARSKGKTSWYMPGGKRESGETDQQALTREIKEELSVDLVPATFEYAGVFEAQADGKSAGTLVRMTCYFAEHTGSIEAAAEIEEVMWLSYGDRATCSATAQQVLDWLQSKGHIE